MPTERVELEPTANGFQCCYSFMPVGLFVQVRERWLKYDEAKGERVGIWFTHSSVDVFFSVSLEQARRVVEHHVRLYDTALVETLAPIWAAWETPPVSAVDPTDSKSIAAMAEAPPPVAGAQNAHVRLVRGE